MESKLRIRKTQSLRRGRVSVPKARYFVTICTLGREPILCSNRSWVAIVEQLESQQFEGDYSLLSAVLMPDHLHVVFRLGERLKLGQVVAKFKAKVDLAVSWQGDFYDHRLRHDESDERYAFYLFMNPFRAGLCGLDQKWIFWNSWKEAPLEFEMALSRSKIIPSQWLAESEKVRASLEAE